MVKLKNADAGRLLAENARAVANQVASVKDSDVELEQYQYECIRFLGLDSFDVINTGTNARQKSPKTQIVSG